MSIFFTPSTMGQAAAGLANTPVFDAMQPAYATGFGDGVGDAFEAQQAVTDSTVFYQKEGDGDSLVKQSKGAGGKSIVAYGNEAPVVTLANGREAEIKEKAREVVATMKQDPSSVKVRLAMSEVGIDALTNTGEVAELLQENVGSLMRSLGSEGKVLKQLGEVQSMMKVVEGPWYARAMDAVSEKLPFGMGAGKRMAIRWERLKDVPKNVMAGLKEHRAELENGIVAFDHLTTAAKSCQVRVEEAIFMFDEVIAALKEERANYGEGTQERAVWENVIKNLERRKTQMIVQRGRLTQGILVNLVHIDINEAGINEIEMTLDDVAIGMPMALAQLAGRARQKAAQLVTGKTRAFNRQLNTAVIEGARSGVEGQLELERDGAKDVESVIANMKRLVETLERYRTGRLENHQLIGKTLRAAKGLRGGAEKAIAEFQETRRALGLANPRAALEEKDKKLSDGITETNG